MRINFERTGGFAGTRMATVADTSTLPPEQANQLRRLVEAADFFHLPATITSPTSGADRFQYRLAVEENGVQHTVTVSERALPAPLRPLIEWLVAAARQK
jgi:hypothetical protein